jgi:two-component system sensor histidine kinase ChiS
MLSNTVLSVDKKASKFAELCEITFKKQPIVDARKSCLLNRKLAEKRGLLPQVKRILKVLIKIESKSANHLNVVSLFKEQSLLTSNKLEEYFLARGQASYYYHLGKFSHAEKYFIRGFALAKQLDEPIYLAKSYNDIGLVHFRKLEYKKAILFYKKSLAIKEQLNRIKDSGVTLNNIGLIYYRLGEFKKSLKYYSQAFEKYQKALHSDPDSKLLIKKITHINTDLSAVYLRLGERELSSKKLKDVFSDIEHSQSNNEKIARLTDLAEGLLDNNEYTLASTLLKKAESYIPIGSERHAKLLFYIGEAESHLENWSKSKQYTVLAIEKAEKNKDDSVLLRAYGLLSQIYFHQGNFENAFKNLRHHELINQEDTKKRYDDDLRQVKYEFEIERAEKELLTKEVALLSSENSNYKLTAVIYIFIVLLGFLFIISYYKISLNKQKRKLLLAELEKHKTLLLELDKPLINFKHLFQNVEEHIVACTEAGYLIYTNIPNLKNKPNLKVLNLRELSKSLNMTLENVSRSGKNLDMNIQKFDFLESEYKVKVFPVLNNEYVIFQFFTEVAGLFDVSGKLNLINRFSRSLNSLEVDKTDTASLRPLIVDVMELCVKTWVKITDTNKVEFAEQSHIWKVNIDDGRLRTRSLDKYLSVNTLPKQPRLKNVIKSCHFMLSQNKLIGSERELIEGYLAKIMEFEDH